MSSKKKIILLQLAIFISAYVYAGNNFLQQDTLRVSDSMNQQQDCNDKFFENSSQISSPGKTMLVLKSKKNISLKDFFKYNSADTIMGYVPKQGLADLDNDGKKELVLFDYTGGAHCCDEFFIFRNIAPDKYLYVTKMFAGDVCITDKNEFIYDFYQQYGYFFTCFACAYNDSSDAAPKPVHSITLKYSKGKFLVVPGNKELKSTISENLEKLSKQPYQHLQDEADQDNGLRKEFALNLVVSYYSFGRNLVETKKLFDKYYHFSDSIKVWERFVQLLNGIKKDSDF